MKNILTITFAIDNKWEDKDTREQRIDDESSLLAYAMDILRDAVLTNTGEFEKAELNGKMLFSKNGEAPKKVKQLPQYEWTLEDLEFEKGK